MQQNAQQCKPDTSLAVLRPSISSRPTRAAQSRSSRSKSGAIQERAVRSPPSAAIASASETSIPVEAQIIPEEGCERSHTSAKRSATLETIRCKKGLRTEATKIDVGEGKCICCIIKVEGNRARKRMTLGNHFVWRL